MLVGGLVLLLSAILLIWVLYRTQRNDVREANPDVQYAEPVHPVMTLPNTLNGFALWNWIILVYIVVSYGYPIAQFFLMPTYGAFPWSI